MHLKVSKKCTNKFFDSLLKLLKDVLPKGNRLLVLRYDAKKKMTKLVLGYKSFHACNSDRVLFRKEHADKNVGLVCDTS